MFRFDLAKQNIVLNRTYADMFSFACPENWGKSDIEHKTETRLTPK